MKNDKTIKSVLRALNRYLTFFLLIAFVITCCLMLFVSTLANSLGITLTRENLNAAAKLTFWNVIFISLIFTAIDAVRRKITVERPVQQISEAAKKITQGDFNVRVSPVPKIIAEDKFNDIVECFNKMAQELASVETLRTDFIANVSHEMKTPLAVMQNYATLLQTPNLPDKNRIEYAKAVNDACFNLANLITNVLKLNKLENQKIYPVIKQYNLSEQICECLLLFENEWEQKNINIETAIDERVMIDSDAELLAIVWNNLFSNAIKFTPAGGTVFVCLTATKEDISVKVSDTGCGMTPETGAHIFDKFYQGDTSHATKGNGLGLALVKRVVDIVRGEIQVESEPGKGSVFTVKFRSA